MLHVLHYYVQWNLLFPYGGYKSYSVTMRTVIVAYHVQCLLIDKAQKQQQIYKLQLHLEVNKYKVKMLSLIFWTWFKFHLSNLC